MSRIPLEASSRSLPRSVALEKPRYLSAFSPEFYALARLLRMCAPTDLSERGITNLLYVSASSSCSGLGDTLGALLAPHLDGFGGGENLCPFGVIFKCQTVCTFTRGFPVGASSNVGTSTKKGEKLILTVEAAVAIPMVIWQCPCQQ